MRNRGTRWLGRSLAVAMAALSSACAEGPVAPAGTTSAHPVADITSGNRLPDLTACPQLAAPEGSTLVLQAFGVGAQIYHWNGTSWGVATPDATLYADAGLNAVVATHFAGPTWKSNSGGTVVGTVSVRCTPDAASIAWLLLTAAPEGAGIFARVGSVQRLNTVGGNPPSVAGTVLGQEARVPYTADYLFYKAP